MTERSDAEQKDITMKLDQRPVMLSLVLSFLFTACVGPRVSEISLDMKKEHAPDPIAGRLKILSSSGQGTLALLSVAKAGDGRVFGIRAGETALFELNDGDWKATDRLGRNPSSMNYLTFVDPMVGFAMGNGGTLFRTSNGGANWSKIKEFTNYNLDQAAFLDGSTGYVVGERSLVDSEGGLTYYTKVFLTTDGGLSWSKVLELDSAGTVTGIAALSESTVVVSFNNKGVLRSGDKGRPWKFVDSSLHTMGLSFNGSKVGMSIDNDGNLYRSGDLGNTWKRAEIADPSAAGCKWGAVAAAAHAFLLISSDGCIASSIDGTTLSAIEHVDGRLGAIFMSNGSAFIAGDSHIYGKEMPSARR